MADLWTRLSGLRPVLDVMRGMSGDPANGNGKSNGNGRHHVKGLTLGPGVLPGSGIQFFSPDGTRTIYQLGTGGLSEVERVTVETAYAAAAYAYAALRYRATKLAEPPLMVVREDEDGNEEWLRNHPLAELLESPHPDFDMGELIARTSLYVDITGHALHWKEANGLGRPGRLTPYHGGEFTVEATADRIRGQFRIHTSRGQRTVPAEEVVYFHELDPGRWDRGLSRLDVALSFLNLGQQARATVGDILRNAIFPSAIIQADPEWNPDDDEWKRYKEELESHAERVKMGKPLALIGGGTATVVTPRLKDLIPTDILDRVESVISAVFGIPSIVLQFEVGMKNSPWSQMADARRMCYEDTIEPLWRGYEKALTRQLLRAPMRTGGRPLDAATDRFIRFDTSHVRALQKDRLVQAQTAVTMGDAATLNERRSVMGLDPIDDPAADEVPELSAPDLSAFGSLFGGGSRDDDEDEDQEEAEDDAEREAEEEAEKRRRRSPARKARAPKAPRHRKQTRAEFRRQVFRAITDAVRQTSESAMEFAAAAQLATDLGVIRSIVQTRGGKAGAAPPSVKQDEEPISREDARRIRDAVESYLDGDAPQEWRVKLRPMIEAAARTSIERAAAMLGIDFDLLQPGLVKFVEREAAFLITSVTDTTKDAVRRALGDGLTEGEGIRGIAKRIEDAGAFSPERAKLIARTESIRSTNGATTESLQAYARDTGLRVTKTWLTQRDARVRDEHRALEGETVDVDQPFSNGLQYPGEPNCRCTVTNEVAV